jgi:beta-hydroxyacyl-ACP dehydratase FabZ
VIDIRHIMKALPHRYPFLLVDRVLEVDPGKRVVAIKNVTCNEPFFPGHFPGEPIMPGVLIIEAMAQAAAVMMLMDMEDADHKLVFFTGIDKARFRRTVVPGDQLRMTLECVKHRTSYCKFRGVAEVDGVRVAEAEMMSALVDRSKD